MIQIIHTEKTPTVGYQIVIHLSVIAPQIPSFWEAMSLSYEQLSFTF